MKRRPCGDSFDGKHWRLMSDIGILNNPLDLAVIALVIGAPGLVLGGLIGALAWRRRRIAGGLTGAVVGFGLWLAGWMWFTDAL